MAEPRLDSAPVCEYLNVREDAVAQVLAALPDDETLYDLSDRLRMRGWLVPAYPLPADLEQITVQRIVIRNGVTMDLAEALLATIREEVAYLDALTSPLPDRSTAGTGFTH